MFDKITQLMSAACISHTPQGYFFESHLLHKSKCNSLLFYLFVKDIFKYILYSFIETTGNILI